MASIAEHLGITWAPLASEDTARAYMLTPHAERQIHAKGFDRAAVLEAANNPAHTYENFRYAGQMRHIRGDICAVVDPATFEIVTVYLNVTATALRADQARDRNAEQRADALRFEQRRKAGAYNS